MPQQNVRIGTDDNNVVARHYQLSHPVFSSLPAFREETKSKKSDSKPKVAPMKAGESAIEKAKETRQDDGVDDHENGESPSHRKEADSGADDSPEGIAGQDGDVDILEGEREGMQELQ